ncbi:MAG: hypothetical protein AB7L13_01590 [Acidimicrobiia bacterium]
MRRRFLIAFEIASLLAIVAAVVVTMRSEHRASPVDSASSVPSSSATIAVSQGGPDPVATAAMIDAMNLCLAAKGSSVRLSPTLTTIFDPADRADVDDCGRLYLAQPRTPSSPIETAVNDCLLRHGATATIKVGASVPTDVDRQLLDGCLTDLLRSSK